MITDQNPGFMHLAKQLSKPILGPNQKIIYNDGTDIRVLDASRDRIALQPILFKSFTLPLNGIVDPHIEIVGQNRSIGTGKTGNVTNAKAISNNQLYIKINSLASGGIVTITGTSVDDNTGVPVIGDTEQITVDSIGLYQTEKAWWETTLIDVSALSGVNYDYGLLTQMGFVGRSFRLIGYTFQGYAQSNTADFRFTIKKLKDLGNKKKELISLEDIGFDSGNSGNQIIDHIRTGTHDRTLNPVVSNIVKNNSTMFLGQYDLSDYFTAGEPYFDITKEEGIIVDFGGEGGGFSGMDFITVYIGYILE